MEEAHQAGTGALVNTGWKHGLFKTPISTKTRQASARKLKMNFQKVAFSQSGDFLEALKIKVSLKPLPVPAT